MNLVFILKKAIKFVFRYSFSYLLNFILITFALFKILKNIKNLYFSDNIIFQVDGGFGNVILAWDFFRRIYPNQKNIIFFTVYSDSYNTYLEKLESPCLLVLFKKNFSFLGNISYKPKHWEFFNILLFKFFKILFKKKNVLIGPKDFYLCNYNDQLKFKPTNLQPFKEHLYMAYIGMKKKTRSLDNFFLKQKYIEMILSEIKQKTKLSKFKICTIYLRGDRKSLFKVTKNRNGGDSKSYEKIINHLLKNNYIVCITGCGDLEYLKYKFKTNKNVIFDDFSHFSKNLVNLYFLTEVDFVVANMGGAIFASISKSVPTIVVNSFPLNVGWLNCVHYYKKMIDERGKEINILNIKDLNYDELSKQNEFGLVNNSDLEIYKVVCDFEKNLKNKEYGLKQEKIGISNNNMNFLFFDTKISPLVLSLKRNINNL